MSTRVNVAIPLKVPWKLSPSVSAFRVEVTENDAAEVAFDVYDLSGRDGVEDLEFLRVVMEFPGGQWVRMYPVIDDDDPDLLGRFDWGSVPSFFDATRSPHETGEEFRSAWRAAGVCPDPWVYEVESSTWLGESGAGRFGCRHFLVRGREMWVEVLALGYSWRWHRPARSSELG
ncbi:hypothetical protein Mterra_00146 [Calidithermus terrae]|uniref:Uncharacterized protein n=1 Tax=Calidithermus terrae TaxID=1408545 RepID=A0A399F219_9DEIN|nr:hypothetical protein Mterra_00146 [Calidithermus terrae]